MSDDKNIEKILQLLDELIYNYIVLESVLVSKTSYAIFEDEILKVGGQIVTLSSLSCCRNEIKKLLLEEGESSNV